MPSLLIQWVASLWLVRETHGKLKKVIQNNMLDRMCVCVCTFTFEVLILPKSIHTCHYNKYLSADYVPYLSASMGMTKFSYRSNMLLPQIKHNMSFITMLCSNLFSQTDCCSKLRFEHTKTMN